MRGNVKATGGALSSYRLKDNFGSIPVYFSFNTKRYCHNQFDHLQRRIERLEDRLAEYHKDMHAKVDANQKDMHAMVYESNQKNSSDIWSCIGIFIALACFGYISYYVFSFKNQLELFTQEFDKRFDGFSKIFDDSNKKFDKRFNRIDIEFKYIGKRFDRIDK